MYEEITLATYNRIAKKYTIHTVFPAFRKIIERSAHLLISLLPANRRTSMLILGSGDGRDASLFVDYIETFILYDYSDQMMSIARSKLPNAQCITDDFRNIQLPKQSIDTVWASTCLYHVQKRYLPSILDAIYDTLQPGGLLYLNLKIGKGERLISHPTSYPHGGSRFYAFYEKEEVLALVYRFEVVYYIDKHPEIDIPYMQIILKKS